MIEFTTRDESPFINGVLCEECVSIHWFCISHEILLFLGVHTHTPHIHVFKVKIQRSSNDIFVSNFR